MKALIDPIPSPPDWLTAVLNTQFFFSFSLAVAGFFHLAAHGILSKLYTGIYVGVFSAVATYFEKWIFNRTSSQEVTYTRGQLQTCQWVAVAALLLCAINVPMVALFSIAYGDAFGRPFDENAPFCFFCFEYGQTGANLPAVICDAGLLLFGIINSLLISASGSYFWTLAIDGQFWLVRKFRYGPVLGTRS